MNNSNDIVLMFSIVLLAISKSNHILLEPFSLSSSLVFRFSIRGLSVLPRGCAFGILSIDFSSVRFSPPRTHTRLMIYYLALGSFLRALRSPLYSTPPFETPYIIEALNPPFLPPCLN